MQSEWLRSEVVEWDQLRRFSDAGYLYAILDACDAPSVLAKVQELGERATSLFQGTPQEEYWAHAPYLVIADAALLDWIRASLSADPWGIFILANVGMAELRAHFQHFLTVQLPDGEHWFFRYYDPRVFSVYLPSSNSEELRQFFGPVRGFALPQDDGVQLLQPAAAGESMLARVPWPIRAEQYELLARASLRDFETRAAAHLGEFFPEQCRSLGQDGLLRAIAYGVQRSHEYGIRTECDVCQYLDLMFGLGPDFDRDPKLPWAGEILRRNEPAEPAARLAQLFDRLEQTANEWSSMGRLDPVAAVRARRAALDTMPLGTEVGCPKVKVTVTPPVGTGPEPPSADELALAAAAGSSPEQRAAREKVLRDFYQNRMGLGAPRCAQDVQAVDLDSPVAVTSLPPATRLRSCAASDEPSNVFARPVTPVSTGFEVTEAFDALGCSSKSAGPVLVIDDADRERCLREL